jgi:hypothetical protein
MGSVFCIHTEEYADMDFVMEMIGPLEWNNDSGFQNADFYIKLLFDTLCRISREITILCKQMQSISCTGFREKDAYQHCYHSADTSCLFMHSFLSFIVTCRDNYVFYCVYTYEIKGAVAFIRRLCHNFVDGWKNNHILQFNFFPSAQ